MAELGRSLHLPKPGKRNPIRELARSSYTTERLKFVLQFLRQRVVLWIRVHG